MPFGLSLGGGGGGEAYIQGAIIFGAIILVGMPLLITTLMVDPTDVMDDPMTSEEIRDDVLQAYLNFTGSTRKEQPWCLTGIYEPYLGGSYNYSPDGWLYGRLVTRNSPYQYIGMDQAFTVVRGLNGEEGVPSTNVVYTYSIDGDRKTYDGHSNGDVYTYIVMDSKHKSDIFFTDQLKKTSGEYFYYEYTGYRYCFQPLESGYTVVTENGKTEIMKVNNTTSSLSLIWYDFASQSGISGQLIISGSDQGVAYLTAEDIIKAFNSVTSTARFEMNFNGVPMAIYIRMDPSLTSEYSIEECYNKGYWSIMVASYTTESVAYTTQDYSFSPEKIWETTISLLTFNLNDYNLSPTMKTVASLTFCLVLMAMLLAIGINHPMVLVVAGIAAVIVALQDFFTDVEIFFQNIISFFTNFEWPDIDWDWPWDR